ncbi:hypothetical protein EPUS_00619 [Endocarpon pusillum Z07020]|uniref:Cytochrome b5 heme-binding domain-containing protein n=1 Tax=Endocarpon pusillum (strain Z07020 / HMAS-L-300199) TaxID=1263415 RepID=U1HMU2_ENDPU|nr:uncharacterized protein EPUS_00619 [Endocarpon pusillum Z07020]ERF71630.1 hypothetical protein EPUS_00619 [Endocarpon pusillum Z07020]
MGWLSVGLLVVSGGCILYRHPPASIIQLLLGRGFQRKECLAQQSQTAEVQSRDGDDKQEPSFPGSSPSILIVATQEGNDAVPADGSPPSATPSAVLSPSSVGASTKLAPSPVHAPPVKSPAISKPPTFSSMPPPPRPSTSAPLRPPPSAAASLRVPPTKNFSNAAFAPSRLTAKSPKSSRQVTLTPGHSPLDWAALTSDPNNKLRGKDAPTDQLIRVSPSRLRYQNGRKGRDAWTEYQGKVYNITPYLPFHPGGESELMKGAGRDAATLFMEVHPWVNWEAMLGECLVGILVSEGEEQHGRNDGAAELDEMD